MWLWNWKSYTRLLKFLFIDIFSSSERCCFCITLIRVLLYWYEIHKFFDFFLLFFPTVYSLNRPWRDYFYKFLNFFSFYFCELKNRWMKKSLRRYCEYQFLLSFYFRNYRELVIVMALASFLLKVSKAVELVSIQQISFQKKLGLLLFWFLAMH